MVILIGLLQELILIIEITYINHNQDNEMTLIVEDDRKVDSF